jgi:hypothetical protein
MIKQTRKLDLSRSTLRRLDDGALEAAAAGGIVIPPTFSLRCPDDPPRSSRLIECPQ